MFRVNQSQGGRRTSRLHISDYAVYATLGITLFAITVGFDKLNPRNIAWLLFNDQVTHWIGWRFFAESRWEWPPGANTAYGWESTTSIIATDSWPLFALIFKILQLPGFDKGQYFGLGYLAGSVALTLGSARLLAGFAVIGIKRFMGVIIIVTVPMFWYMHQWYPALSGGMALLVWAFCLYFEDLRRSEVATVGWTLLLVIGVSTQFYLFAILCVIYGVTLLQCWDRDKWKRFVAANSLVLLLVLVVMYLLGYFMIPLTRASTGSGYGEFSANLLAPIDSEGSSRWLFDLPSTAQQYEPTFVGLGAVVLIFCLVFARRMNVRHDLRHLVHRHKILAVALALMSVVAVSNIITLGEWSFRVPIPVAVEQALSVFRSSVRFVWPLILMIVVSAILLVVRHLPKATLCLLFAASFQILDVSGAIETVSERPNGRESVVQFDEELWKKVPFQYEIVAQHPAGNYKEGWAECAYAALSTSRSAQCAYLARIINLTEFNLRREISLENGRPSTDTIYLFDYEWVKTHAGLLLSTYNNGRHGFTLTSSGVLMFPECQRFQSCSFLQDSRMSVQQVVAKAGL